MEPKRAKTITPSQIRHLLRVTEATSRKHPMNTVLQSPVSGIAVQVLDFFKKTGATFQR